MSNEKRHVVTPELAAVGMGRTSRWASVGASVVIGCFLIYLAAWSVRAPLCCADDASIAVVSKNLANGLGYLSTTNYWGADFDYEGNLFDPAISTGAPSVLAVALAIKIFGPEPALPGLVHVLLNGMLLIFIWRQVSNAIGASRAALAMVVLLVLVLATGSYHLEQWYAQLGEVLSVLLVIAAACMLALGRPSLPRILVSGILMGAAILTKQIAAVYLMGALAFFAFPGATPLYGMRAIALERLTRLAWFIVGLLSPIASYEVWKAFTLGVTGWRENWRGYLAFLVAQGTGGGESGALDSLTGAAEILLQRYFIPAWLIAASTALALASLRFADRSVRQLWAVLGLGLAAHFAYWVWFSVQWARYFYMGLVVWLFLLAIAVVLSRGLVRIGLLACVVVMLTLGLPRGQWTAPIASGTPPSISDAEAIAAVIELDYPTSVIQVEWWAHAADLEYLSSLAHRYVVWNEPRYRDSSDRVIVVNKSYLSDLDQDFESFVARDCLPVQERGVYSLYSCGETG